MKRIPLTQGYEALVSDEDYERVSALKWYAAEMKPGYVYAKRDFGGGRQVGMHRFILGTPKGMVADHINGNTLDNRRENLRSVTHAENVRHITKPSRAISGHRNVYRFRNGFIVKGWRDGVRYYGGFHKTLAGALEARDRIAAIASYTQAAA